jgi:hypothetical protein
MRKIAVQINKNIIDVTLHPQLLRFGIDFALNIEPI